MTLDKMLTQLIAERHGVGKEVVTSEWIAKKREEDVYPHMHFRTSAVVGGHNGLVVRCLSGNQLKALRAWGDAWIRQFASFR